MASKKIVRSQVYGRTATRPRQATKAPVNLDPKMFYRSRIGDITAQHRLADRAAKKTPEEKQLARMIRSELTKAVPGASGLIASISKTRTVSYVSKLVKQTLTPSALEHWPVFHNDLAHALKEFPPMFVAIGLAEGKLKGKLLGGEQHVFGEIPYDDDDRRLGSAIWFKGFQLPASVSEPRGGAFMSHPFVEVSGTITGWTGVHNFIWAADDKWCKCRLFLTQSVFQPTFGGVIPLGQATEMRVLLNEENNGGAAHAILPGLIRMPPVAFRIVNAVLPVSFNLEVRFEVELEGDSGLWFGPDANSALGSPFVVPGPMDLIPI